MKKKLSLIVLFISVCLNLSAYTVYLAPMEGSRGIPMNPFKEQGGYTGADGKIVPQNVHYSRIEGYVNKDGGTLVFNPYNSVQNSALPYQQYTDQEMIALGGIKELVYTDDVGNASLTLHASCPNGFYFVSQSNPSYKRPFELYVIPKAYRIIYEWPDFYRGEDAYGVPRVLSESNNKISLKYSELSKNYVPLVQDWAANRGAYHQLWFDMVLVLPGTIENDVLTLDGKKYPLTEADDYSAVVTIDMQATVKGKNETIQTITIPFSGFYEPEQKPLAESSVSMYVHPVASAGNLNMRNYGRQQIADIEVMVVDRLKVQESGWYKGTILDTFLEEKKDEKGNVISSKNYYVRRDNACGIFLSSSADPYTPGDHFKLIRENLSYDEPLTDYNSVDFDAYMINNKNRTEEYKYDGTMTVSSSLNASNCKNVTNLVVPSKQTVQSTHSTPIDYWYYSGSIYIAIKDNSAIIMEAGRYTSTVYVHVMGF